MNILIYGLFALGFNMLYGYLGLLSFGHAALFGGGAYACGIAMVTLGLPWWAGVAASVLAGAALAGAIGALAIRTRGIYFAMVTLALSQCVYYAAYEATGLTGGENGLRGVDLQRIGPLDFLDPLTRYYVVWRLRGGRAVRAVAHPGLPVRRGDGGAAGERGPRPRPRL